LQASSNAQVVKSYVVNHLKTDYAICESEANDIYNETNTLFHELLTCVDLKPLKTKNEKILSSLIVLIHHNVELDDDANQ